MFEYKITSAHLLMATLTDSMLLAVNVFLYAALVVCYVKTKSGKSRRVILAFALLLPVAYAAPALLKTFIGWDWYGYELYREKIHIRAWPVDEVINPSNSTIFLTDSEEWRPKLRKFGLKAGDISMGYHILNNGAEAVVFKHKDSERFVVIDTGGNYYVIVHSGVENFYEKG